VLVTMATRKTPKKDSVIFKESIVGCIACSGSKSKSI
jgi:hypothetical protein